MRIIPIAVATAFAAGLVYHGPSQVWLIPLAGIPLLLVVLWFLPSQPLRGQLMRTNPGAGAAAALPWLFLAWTLWLLLGIAWSAWPAVSYWYFLTLAWYPVAFVVLGAFPRTSVRLWDWVLGIGAVGVGIGLVEWLFTGGRANSLFIDPNSFAALINLLLFAGLGETLIAPPGSRRRLPLAALLVLLAATLVLTQSRGAWIAFSGGVVLAALVLWRFQSRLDRRPLWTGLVSVGVGLAVGALLLGLGDLSSRAGSIADTGIARWMIWQATLQAIAAHGWLGTGLGSFVLIYPQFRNPAEIGTTGFMAHNDYLQFALETGLPGVLLFVAITLLIFWLFLRHCFSRRGHAGDRGAAPIRAAGLLGLVGVLTVHAHAAVNFVFYETAVTVAAGTVLALAFVRLGLVADRADKAAARPRFQSWAVVLCGILSVGLLVDAGEGGLLNENRHGPRLLGGPRYQAALALSAFYPFNTIATTYALTAQAKAAQAGSIPPLKAMAEDMAIQSAKTVLVYKARDCMAETILASFPVKPLQRRQIQQAAAFDQAQAELGQVIRQLPMCVAAYMKYADLLEYRGRPEQALATLLAATERFNTRTYDETNRLRLFARAGQLAQSLGQAATATAMALSLRANQADNPWAQAYLEKDRADRADAKAAPKLGG